jgi:hypothetical protein
MKTQQKKRRLIFFLSCCTCLIFLHIMNCRIDHGLEPIYSKIGGNIFFTGEEPPKTEEVRVAVAKDFPPKRINQLLFSDRIPHWQDTAYYEIYLPEGTYDVIAVIWKEKYGSWNISDIVGVYGGSFSGDLLFPTFKSVTIPHKDAVLDTIDIQANLNRVNRDAKIEGTVTFVGPWPQNTGTIAVGGFIEIPEKGNLIDYYFKSVYIDYSIPPFVEREDYLLRVHYTDTLKYISVLWIDDAFDLSSLRDIGFYKDPQDTTQPGMVTFTEDSTRTGIDITVDFSEM